MSKKHPQKKETLILTFSEPFFSIVAVFVLKMALVFFLRNPRNLPYLTLFCWSFYN